MRDNLSIPYHEIDFLLPSHRFNISFSYVTQKGLPFIREFMLRLIHLAPMKPFQVASYFGLSERELKEAISDLVEKGDIEHSDDGLVSLTAQSKGYFSDLGSTPEVATVLQIGGVFGFELASFNCTGSKRTHEKWVGGIALEVSNENVGLSDKFAKKHFQKQFYSLLDAGYLKQLRKDDKSGRPSIYKMESVNKIGQEPVRITQEFSIDINGSFMERNELDEFEDPSEIVDLITQSIHKHRRGDNLKEIFHSMEFLGDDLTGKYITESGVDVERMLSDIASGSAESSASSPFLGPLYSRGNWRTLMDTINPILDKMKKEHLDGLNDFIWVAPSDSFWGQSKNFSVSFSELVNKAKVEGRKAKTLYKPKLYVPMSGGGDRKAVNKWGNNIAKDFSYVNGLVEGFLDGNVEIVLLPDRFVAVCYHIAMPEKTLVTVPLGFMTTNKTKIRRIQDLISDYKAGLAKSGMRNDLGELMHLK